jgi:hypothetical protein
VRNFETTRDGNRFGNRREGKPTEQRVIGVINNVPGCERSWLCELWLNVVMEKFSFSDLAMVFNSNDSKNNE